MALSPLYRGGSQVSKSGNMSKASDSNPVLSDTMNSMPWEIISIWIKLANGPPHRLSCFLKVTWRVRVLNWIKGIAYVWEVSGLVQNWPCNSMTVLPTAPFLPFLFACGIYQLSTWRVAFTCGSCGGRAVSPLRTRNMCYLLRNPQHRGAWQIRGT